MPRYLLAFFCAATLSLVTAAGAAEPGEGLIDGLIAQIRQLEERLEQIDVRVDKNSAAIDRAAKPQIVAQPEKQPKQVKAVQKERAEKSIPFGWTPKEPVDYAGRWLMTLPLGAEHTVVIKEAPDHQFQLVRPRLNLAGVYKADGATLTIVQPDDKRLMGFAWTAINRNTLILTGEPPRGRTGSSYAGATLTRLVDSPE